MVFIECSSGNDKPVSKDAEQEEPRKGIQKKIIVYGSMHCIHCHQFRRKLDSKGIEYEFRDIDANDEFFHEMQKKIKSIDYKGYVQYPVIDIEGIILVNPDFKEAEKMMFTGKD